MASLLATLEGIWSRYAPMIEAGTLDLGAAGASASAYSPELTEAARLHSPFHRVLGEETKLREALYQEPWFHAYRLVLNLLYLFREAGNSAGATVRALPYGRQRGGGAVGPGRSGDDVRRQAWRLT